MEFVRVQPQVTIAVRRQIRRGFRQMLLSDAAGAFARIRREGGDEHQCFDVVLVAGLADHRTAIGMPHQHHRALHLRHHLARALGIVGQ
ncbi:hypothetical protein D3C71_1793100 [compost metagenome]